MISKAFNQEAEKMKRRSAKLKVPSADVESLAAKLCDKHADRMARGFRLAASSGFWQLKDRSITARFVYRARRNAPGEAFTITETFTGLRLD